MGILYSLLLKPQQTFTTQTYQQFFVYFLPALLGRLILSEVESID